MPWLSISSQYLRPIWSKSRSAKVAAISRAMRECRFLPPGLMLMLGLRFKPSPTLPAAAEIEAFVVEQIRRLARDPELVRQIYQQARQMQQTEIDRRASEKRLLQKQWLQRHEHIRRLVGALRSGDDPTGTILRHDQQIEADVERLTRRIAAIDTESATLRANAVDPDHVACTLFQFDALWEVLIPAERSRLIHLLIERVEYAPSHEVRMVFRTADRNSQRSSKSPGR